MLTAELFEAVLDNWASIERFKSSYFSKYNYFFANSQDSSLNSFSVVWNKYMQTILDAYLPQPTGSGLDRRHCIS